MVQLALFLITATFAAEPLHWNPNPAIAYHNFNPATGAELLHDDFLKDDDDAYPHLKEIAQRYFEKEIADDGFYLTDNFGFSKTGLRFTWNPYDLGPRVVNGTIEIPYSELLDLLKPQYFP